MEPQIRQLPPHVVAPEVAAGARDVVAGRPLTSVGRKTIEEARLQLEVERDAIRQSSASRFDRVTALAQSGGSSLQLATLALEQSDDGREFNTYEERIDYATTRLDEIASDLARLEDNDVVAAGRIDVLFDEIVERVLAPAGFAG